jgi:D-glycero-alpha-D-manno-heptose-7-phosphate kinase
MLITRTPFRASFFGGGTDIPWFYENNGGGAVISAAIDKYMYLSAHPMFDSRQILLKYSKIELVESASDLGHPIAREILTSRDCGGIDIGVSADIPAGTGLGSSSAFTVSLLNLVNGFQGKYMNKHALAEAACDIEINKLGEPIGKQDQYASAFGGLNKYEFQPDGSVSVTPLVQGKDVLATLDQCLFLVRVGTSTRSASAILRGQRESSVSDQRIVDSLKRLRDFTLDSFEVMQNDPERLGELLTISWDLKRESSPAATNDVVDAIISEGLEAGATGAKLLGAGGGGFVLFYVPLPGRDRFVKTMSKSNPFNVSIDFQGSAIVYHK